MSDTAKPDAGGSETGQPDSAGLDAAMLANDRVVELGRPLLRELADASGETAALAIWADTSAVTILCEDAHGTPAGSAPRIGEALPADSAQGVALLAHLHDDRVVERAIAQATDEQRMRLPALIEDARQHGYATSGAAPGGVAVIAATVHERSGDVAASIAIIVDSEALRGHRLDELVSELKATADDLSLQLGFVAG